MVVNHGRVAPTRDRVHFAQTDDGRLWAIGTGYKASFGADGFVYVPFFGSSAPRNFPVQFRLRSVRIGNRELALAPAEPQQIGTTVTFARGAVTERYELALDHVEQIFVVDSALRGDVEVELQVTSELGEDRALPGLQFHNELGSVSYGSAHVVNGAVLEPVPTTFDGQTIRIHVAESHRTGDRLVIDPLIQSSTTPASSFNIDQGQPDLAYDVTFDRYLVVWEEYFSATDTDVWTQYRDGTGADVPSSLQSVDVSGGNYLHPKVANINQGSAFLIVFEFFDTVAGRFRIQGQRRLAVSNTLGSKFTISDPTLSVSCYRPDIGGDPSTLVTATRWLVVWQRNNSATDSDIEGRLVRSDTTFATPVLTIANANNHYYNAAFVSQSNGNGLTASPCWMVAYEHEFSPTDRDIWGAAIDVSGAIVTPNSVISAALRDERSPNVSCPATDLGGSQPLFMLAYQHDDTSQAMARLLRPFPFGFVNDITPVNMTTSFNLPGGYAKCDSDGNRFAFVGGIGNRITTFAYDGTQLLQQEPLQSLPGLPAYVRLVSKRSGGGPRTDYGIVDEDRQFGPYRIMVSAYGGHALGSDVTRRATACNGLDIDFVGRSFLGEQLTLTLTSLGTDIPLFAFGMPVPATTALCTQCALGVDPASAILVLGATLDLTMPTAPSIVGAQFAAQGLGLGSGPCVAGLRFSDTIDFTVR
ncbi:MAG: hypothetical protein JNK15_14960 [Planctomycetes bacterium]|nr:hypothetical protein [Planctomycetota bacterium]